VPPLSSDSDIPFLQSKLRNVKAQFSLEDFPAELRSIDSSAWSNMKKLTDVFKVPSARGKRRLPIQYPKCLVLSAKTIQDKLVVMSWFASLSHEQQGSEMETLKRHYRCPRSSASPCRPRNSSGVTSIFDREERVAAWIGQSRSNTNSENGSKRKKNEQPSTLGQLNDRTTRRADHLAELRVQKLIETTQPAVGVNLPGAIEPLLFKICSVASPPSSGSVARMALSSPIVGVQVA
jgi:hypothetical protein